MKDDKVKAIVTFVRGTTIMSMDTIEYYVNKNADIIKFNWGNGYGDKKTVYDIPKEIEGYEKIVNN